MPASPAIVRRLALALPEVTEKICYGTPGFFVRKKLMLRLWEDGETLVCKLPMELREQLLEDSPDVFSITDHYRNYPAILINLNAVGESVLKERIAVAWRGVAPAKLAAKHPGLGTR
ncbi:MAG TPA: MmcQ/YjbR family DNA-binding protein [Lacunisphaera sp.]|nr:MmcQ/YjbR family DNA-binding protein [Lacunisphaera sp.]